MEIKRKFNEQAYKESKHAEQRVISQLCEFFKIENLGDTYSEDLRIYDNDGNYIANADIEVRFKWKTQYFPFNTIHIPIRKRKFLTQNRPFFYFVVNGDGTDCLVTYSKNILKSNIIKLKLHYDYGDVEEEFFDVPLAYWKQGFCQLPSYITDKIKETEENKKQTTLNEFENGKT